MLRAAARTLRTSTGVLSTLPYGTCTQGDLRTIAALAATLALPPAESLWRGSRRFASTPALAEEPGATESTARSARMIRDFAIIAHGAM